MKKSRKILLTVLIFIISVLICSKSSLIFAKYNTDITTKNNYIKNNELTYKKDDDGKTFISGFKIGEKVGEILNNQFGEEYTVKIKDNQGLDITNQTNTKIGTGNKIELYSNGNLEKIYTIIIYGDTNGDSNIGAVDALAIIKNKLDAEKFKSNEYEEAGRVKIETRQAGIVPKSDDALYIIKYKLYSEQYPIDQKMIGTDQEEKIENGDNTEGTTNGTITGGEYNHDNPVIPSGFETVDTEDTNWDSTDGETVDDWNKGLVIQDKKGNQFVWVPVDKTNIEYKKWLANTNDESIKDLSSLRDDTLPNRLTNEKEQIEKYGGFYISRYEAKIPENMTDAINTASADTRNVVGIPVSKKEQIAWNYINYNTAKINAEKMYRTKNIQSGLPTGTQWDILIKWLQNIGKSKLVESTLKEWTSEEYNEYKIVRGEDNGTYPSLYRGKLLPNETNSNTGFRCVLYIQETKLPDQTEKNITITFNSNGGNALTPENKTVTYNSTYGELPVPTKENHTFVGWFTQKTGGTQITNSTIVNSMSNHTLYAHWIANNYTLTVKHYLENANDTEYTYQTGKDNTFSVDYGTIITLADKKITIENGTYKEGKLIENATTATTSFTVTQDTTIYLYYSRNRYTLTLNKGNYIDTVTGTGSYKVGQNVSINAILRTNETGYTNSWVNWTSSNTSLIPNNNIQNATIQMPAGNVILTANATKTANSYTLTIKHYLENANDTGYTYQTGRDSTSNIDYGTIITLADKKITIENGTYKEGKLTENGSATITTTMDASNKTIYLYYSRNKYTLSLSRGTNIATVTGNGDYKVGQNVTINATLDSSPTGYSITWSGWTSSNTSLIPNNSTQNATIQMPAGNITLTANANKSTLIYTVTYKDVVDSTNGTVLGTTTESKAYGSSVSGSTKGTNNTVGTYHTDYAYISSTNATVTGNVTVYRIFKYGVINFDNGHSIIEQTGSFVNSNGSMTWFYVPAEATVYGQFAGEVIGVGQVFASLGKMGDTSVSVINSYELSIDGASKDFSYKTTEYCRLRLMISTSYDSGTKTIAAVVNRIVDITGFEYILR